MTIGYRLQSDSGRRLQLMPTWKIGTDSGDYLVEDVYKRQVYAMRGYGGRCEILDTLGDKYQLTVYDPAYRPPSWFGEGITYNIFPDRFCRDRMPVQPEGEGVAPRVLHENWDDIPVYQPDGNGEILNNDFFGGTLRGVIAVSYTHLLSESCVYRRV